MTPYNWTPEKLAAFKRDCEDAAKRKREHFKFDGHTFYVEYAKYLIEYLEQDAALRQKPSPP